MNFLTRRKSLFFPGPKFEAFHVTVSKIDEIISADVFSEIKQHLSEDWLLNTDKSFFTFGVFGRGLGKLVNLAKSMASEINKNSEKEILLCPVWSPPADWNKYFSIEKSNKKKVFFAGKNGSLWLPCFSDFSLDCSLAHVPDFSSSVSGERNLISRKANDLETFIGNRLREVKTKGKLLLVTEIDEGDSSYRLLDITSRVIEKNKDLNSEEKKNIKLNWVVCQNDEIENSLKSFEKNIQIIVKKNSCFPSSQLVSSDLEISQIYIQLIKEKLGAFIFSALTREFNEKVGIMSNIFNEVKLEIDSRDLKHYYQTYLIEKTS